ncbi:MULTISPECIES: hypothetical protein [Olivibacter]|jgi:hypothetical protein|uniref:Uncharacterized protein n=1 Tax=Olivibacter oleidegradans TaxID=760123 RepID=A0ABV6HNE1_9SPHI|nr:MULTISPECIES: hypothetical protein [Olivibacter]MDX3915454.1 hypothetical protein [Pseudosphingobacterium sp.]QEL02905.1 hypothetical protein FKG96_19470 [Olivibacter sp. LS-1]
MALTLSTANGYKVVTGVYEGQGTSAIRIGQTAQTFGGSSNPLVVGFTRLDDLTYTIKAFFDPSLSPLARDQAYDQICFIQVSDFLINGLQTPFQLKDPTSPFLFTNQFNSQSHAPELLKWMNIPKQYDNPLKNLWFPEYPLWALQDDPQLTLPQLYKYPQLYGGYTRYNPAGITRKGNDNLCAFMTLETALSYQGLPVDFNNLTYFNTLDLSTLRGTAIPAIVPFQAPFIKTYLADQGIIPNNAQIKNTQTINGISYFLISYESFAEKANRSIRSKTFLAVWNDGQTTYYAVLDDDLQEEWEEAQLIYGRPDLNALNGELSSRYGYYIKNLSIEKFRLSLRYDTYACATIYNADTKLYHLKVFDGFRVVLTKQYNYIISGNEQWLDTTFHTEPLLAIDRQQFLQTVQAFISHQNPGSQLVPYL